MTNPAMPAQPAKPAEPKKPFDQTGGYVQPPPPGSNAGPLPGGAPPAPTPGAPSPSAPGAAPSPSSVQTTPAGVPPQAAQIGLDEQAYQQVVEEAKESPEPEEFKAQFATLMEQRNMIAPRTQGGGLPTEEYGKYLDKWVREAVAHGSMPKEYGGLGYTSGQAKMMAIVEARRRWPDITPQYWSQALPSGEVSAKELGQVKLADKQAPIEVSPQRAARLDPTKVADILTKPELKKAVEWASAYKERVGSAANAVDFVQDLYNGEVARSKAAQAEFKAAEERTKKYEAYARAKAEEVAAANGVDIKTVIADNGKFFVKDAAGDLVPAPAPLAEYLQASEQKFIESATRRDEAKKKAANIGSEQEILAEISAQGEILSVAAALAQLYT